MCINELGAAIAILLVGTGCLCVAIMFVAAAVKVVRSANRTAATKGDE